MEFKFLKPDVKKIAVFFLIIFTPYFLSIVSSLSPNLFILGWLGSVWGIILQFPFFGSACSLGFFDCNPGASPSFLIIIPLFILLAEILFLYLLSCLIVLYAKKAAITLVLIIILLTVIPNIGSSYLIMEKTIPQTSKMEDIKNVQIGEEYFFSWDEIPGNDNGSLIEFLMRNFGIEWVKTAKIEKIDNGKTIRVSNEKDYLSLMLNDEKNKANLEIDDGRTVEYTAKMEYGKLNIYDEKYPYLKFQELTVQNNFILPTMYKLSEDTVCRYDNNGSYLYATSASWSEIVIINNKKEIRSTYNLIEPYSKKKFYFGELVVSAGKHIKEWRQGFNGNYLLFTNVGIFNQTHCMYSKEKDATAKIIVYE